MFAATLALAVASSGFVSAAQLYVETPYFADDVAQGKLPPVAARLPENPSVATFEGERRPGKPGGEIHTLIASARDLRLLGVFGYARLVGYDEHLALHPDILQAFEVNDNRIFTFHLRPGHKWSDGSPFTSEDFRYYWEDIANNPDLSPNGPPNVMLVDGMPPRFEVIDAITVRYTWKKPNPLFLPALAGAAELFIYRPAHYLKRYHAKYADVPTLQKEVQARRLSSWAALHNYLDAMYRSDNPDLPTLQPWMNITQPPATRFVAVRNPYFHRVDGQGHQLPYIDRVILTQSAVSLIPAKAAAGESDLQARYLDFDNYTFLRQSENRSRYDTLLWRSGTGAHFALYPNLNADDAVWRNIFRDARFRHALSLAIDRDLINQSLFFGLAAGGNDTVLPESPLFMPEYAARWTGHDPARANRMLDDMGLTQRNSRGLRLLPDGRPMELIVETAGEDSEQVDVLQLIQDDWRKIGIKLLAKPSQRNLFRERIYAGKTLMSVWSGLDNGIPTPDMSPAELAPTSQTGLSWPKWGQWFETGGRSGEKPDLPAAEQLIQLNEQWSLAATTPERAKVWQKMLEIDAEEQFDIGVIREVPQPIVVRRNLHNVPRKGIFNWDPGSLLGIYRPDTFWLD
ncbi:MAG TPA: ABC transporter substrate-binding protein [Candidatus Cybelea sp.]|nr:ABC transporter substrate-binding protein [Candidatus Cybelea sp.]